MRRVMVAITVAGCGLFGGGDVVHDGKPAIDASKARFHDPATGACVLGDPAMIGGGTCDGDCGGIEKDCLRNFNCHATYLDFSAVGRGDVFWSCWDIAPQFPIGGMLCPGLDATTCSLSPGCQSVYLDDGHGGTAFEACQANSGPDCKCGSAGVCVVECPPSFLQCPAPPNDGGTALCDNDCTVQCVYPHPCTLACPLGQVCDQTCVGSGCPRCVVSTIDPGQCTGAVTCNLGPPRCGSGTTAGIANGCYTGYCIANSDCGSGSGI